MVSDVNLHPYTVAHPDKVSRLVLVSPDVEYSVAQSLNALKIPTLLIWNKWDPINPFIWTSRFRDNSTLTLHTTDNGRAAQLALIGRHCMTKCV